MIYKNGIHSLERRRRILGRVRGFLTKCDSEDRGRNIVSSKADKSRSRACRRGRCRKWVGPPCRLRRRYPSLPRNPRWDRRRPTRARRARAAPNGSFSNHHWGFFAIFDLAVLPFSVSGF